MDVASAFILLLIVELSQAHNDNNSHYNYDMWMQDSYPYYNWSELVYEDVMPADECPCYYVNKTHYANCAFLTYGNSDKVPACVPNTTRHLNFAEKDLRNWPGSRQFQRFRDLRTLDMHSNRCFQYLDDDTFATLSELRLLDLSGCGIEYLKGSPFRDLVNLRMLLLERNLISKIGKDALIGTPNLTILSLSVNRISFVDSYIFLNLSNLQILDLSYNPYPLDQNTQYMGFTTNSFAGLSSLKYLSLKDVSIANFTFFPAGIFKPLQSLEVLDLVRFCRYSFKLTRSYTCPSLHKELGNLAALRKLFIDADRIIELGPGYKLLTKLEEIELSVVADVVIKFLSNKTFENLNNSPISYFGLSGEPGLFSIEQVEPHIFSAFKDLQVLEFSFRSTVISPEDVIQNIVTGLDKTQIWRLQFSSHCETVENLDFQVISLESLGNTQLQILDLSKSCLYAGYAPDKQDFFAQLPKTLKFIYLQHNTIITLNFINFHTMNQLLVLDISYQNEELLKIKGNTYGINSRKRRGFELIGTVDKHELSPDQEECNPLPARLISLNVSYSSLFYDILETFCSENNSLKFLHASHQTFYSPESINRFWRLLPNLRMLEELYFDGNGITYIPINAFSGLNNMKKLSLAHNRISIVTFRIEKLLRLEMLDISDNKLRRISEYLMGQIETVTQNMPNFTLLIGYNDLDCDCQSLPFLKWLRNTTVVYKNQELPCRYANGSFVYLLEKAWAPSLSTDRSEHIDKFYSDIQMNCASMMSLPRVSSKVAGSSSLIAVICSLSVAVVALVAVVVALVSKSRREANKKRGDDVILI